MKKAEVCGEEVWGAPSLQVTLSFRRWASSLQSRQDTVTWWNDSLSIGHAANYCLVNTSAAKESLMKTQWLEGKY